MRRGSDAVDCFVQSSGVDIDFAGSVVAAVVVMVVVVVVVVQQRCSLFRYEVGELDR